MAKVRNNKAWLFLLPAIVLLGFVAVLPLMMVAQYSFFDVFHIKSKVWVGLDWYRDVLGSIRFWETFGRSMLFSAIVLTIEIPLGIAIAVTIPKKGALSALCLVCMSLPLLVPWNMIAMIWHVFLALAFGAGWTLKIIPTWAAIVLMDVWHWTSLVVLLCYSSLTTIPSAFYQAAAVDGASRWNTFRYIELPKMKAVLIMALLLRFIDSFMVFVEPFRLNAGGPGSSTTFLAMELGQEVVSQDYGPASARAVIYFIMILTLSWAFKKALAAHESRKMREKMVVAIRKPA
ncbi:MAG: sugar ABC transporter permease [Desulfosarcinaceae bacterium]|nr:sugar ABC transporter permease [Desulfosarcinaceae bacterium]